MAAYVDLDGLKPDDILDAGRLRSLMVETVARGDEVVAAHMSESLRASDSRVRWTFLIDSVSGPSTADPGGGGWRSVERLLASTVRSGTCVLIPLLSGLTGPG